MTPFIRDPEPGGRSIGAVLGHLIALLRWRISRRPLPKEQQK